MDNYISIRFRSRLCGAPLRSKAVSRRSGKNGLLPLSAVISCARFFPECQQTKTARRLPFLRFSERGGMFLYIKFDFLENAFWRRADCARTLPFPCKVAARQWGAFLGSPYTGEPRFAPQPRGAKHPRQKCFWIKFAFQLLLRYKLQKNKRHFFKEDILWQS